MDKEYTLTLIRDGLLDGGMDDSTVKANMKKLKKLFDPMTDEEFEKRLAKFGKEEGIVARLMQDYTEKKAAKEEREAVAEKAEASIGEEDSGPDVYVAVTYEDEEETADEYIEPDEALCEDEAAGKAPSEDEGEKPSAEEYFSGDDDEKEEKKPVKKAPSRAKPHHRGKREMSDKGKTTFIVGLVLLLPFIIALVVGVTALFACLYGAIFILTVASCVVLVVGSALGTALSLVAIIYGVIQLYSVMPVGLYEMGLGIVIGGVTLFVCILLYNFVVRLVPYLSKQLFRLYKFLWRQLVRLGGIAKGACEKL